MMKKILLVVTTVTLGFGVSSVFAASSKFKAEDIVEPIAPTIACISAEDLITGFKYASAGEQTRLQALFDSKRCLLTGPGEKLKVITVENSPLIEAVPVSVKGAANGIHIAEPNYRKVKK
ncbi:hypothetical protein [Janthinobacterium sp. PAMC25594]|uniref:hypothetical protein n=1 Tax=Janthinobacterium sp. PAMC25594 TaxID=2861284 RepID=UPI001C63B5A7|nr:hypothetical protein [Janthinobacterium sp. PAMC25594]QYG09021.1 hypothetical protein KY494_09915 [Janthinobacterium sp. PAMC25594]